MNVWRSLFDVDQCHSLKFKLVIKQLFISNKKEEKLSLQIQKKLVRKKECLVLIWHFHRLANKKVFLIMLRYPLLKVFLKDIMELSLHMDKQELEKLTQCKVAKLSINKKVWYLEHSSTWLSQFKVLLV